MLLLDKLISMADPLKTTFPGKPIFQFSDCNPSRMTQRPSFRTGTELKMPTTLPGRWANRSPEWAKKPVLPWKIKEKRFDEFVELSGTMPCPLIWSHLWITSLLFCNIFFGSRTKKLRLYPAVPSRADGVMKDSTAIFPRFPSSFAQAAPATEGGSFWPDYLCA